MAWSSDRGGVAGPHHEVNDRALKKECEIIVKWLHANNCIKACVDIVHLLSYMFFLPVLGPMICIENLV